MKAGLRFFLLAGLLLSAGGPVQAASNLNFTSPIGFFTNFAPRLLTTYFGAPANVSGGTNLVCYGPNGSLQFNIEIYPVNYYTPAVNRLLQLTANLYDATTNSTDLTAGLTATNIEPRFPHVYRPIFGQFITPTSTNICITNYVEETNVAYETPGYAPPGGPSVLVRDINDINPNTSADSFSILNTQPNDIVYGIPLVIGARKGLPNFNQFALQNAVTATRKLQFVRGNWPVTTITDTNVMYNLSISNAAAIQAWNSYSNAYPRNLQMTGSVDVVISLMETNFTPTNATGFQVYSNHFFAQGYTNIPAATWTGYPGVNPEFVAQVPFSFQMPLYTNNMFSGTVLTNFTYRQDPFPTNIPLSSVFESNLAEGAFPIPRWWLHQNTRVRYMLVDTTVTPNRIVDYVSLSQVQNPVDVTYQLLGGQIQIPQFQVGNSSANAEWATNRIQNLNLNVNVPTIAILNQIFVNLNGIPSDTVNWIADMNVAYANDAGESVSFFQENFDYTPGISTIPPLGLTNVFYTPFDPTRTVVQSITWQANDPLVHYLVADLVNTNNFIDPAYTLNTVLAVSPSPITSLSDMTNLNVRYQPWGGNPNDPGRVNDNNIAVKDPLVTRSDNWQFPTNGLPGIGWIGQVHRGTPWQTLYLKPPVGTNVLATFTNWAGDCVITDLFTVPSDSTDIANAQTNGWLVFLSSNAVPRICVDGALSVPTNDWQAAALLDILVNTNNPQLLLSVNNPDTNAWQAILDGFQVSTPTGIFVLTSNSPQAAVIAVGIQSMRNTNYNGSFKRLGDILSVPSLTTASPCLGSTPNLGQGTTINDAMLESIPLQLLPLLRPDSFGSINQNGGAWQLQFTGMDGFGYGMQTSSNLLDWAMVATNYPFDGVFNVTDPAPAPGQRFYRSVLLP